MKNNLKKESVDRGNLSTERINENSKNLDKLNTEDLVSLFSEEDIIPQLAVSRVKTELVQAIDEIARRLENKGQLFYIGAGTSGRLGVLDASECPPTFCTPPDLVQGIIAGGINSLVKSSEGLEDREDLSINDLVSKGFSGKDCLIGITAGGTTPYVISALSHSMSIGALTIGISCVPKDQAFIPCNIDIRLLTGPEILAGSTRLKAGTATKMTLNIISTCVMVKLGKVFGNRMVDLSPTNNKLIDRSIRILSDITSIDRKNAEDLLNKCDGSLKLAILKSLSGLDINSCRKLLKDSHYKLNKALDNL